MSGLTVALLTDSLALPRREPERVALSDTWPALLRQQPGIGDVVHIGIGGATVHQLLGQTGYARGCDPDVVVVQCGIVDCAPRTLKRWEKDQLSRLPGGRRVGKLIEKNARALRGARDIAFTPPARFAAAVVDVVEKAKPARVLWLAIAPASAAYERQVPGIGARVTQYNGLLRAALGDGFVDLAQLPSTGLCSDHHHLAAAGHAFVLQQLMLKLPPRA